MIIGVAVRFFLKRRRRLQQQAAAANSQMRYWNPTTGGDKGAGTGGGFDAEKGIAAGANVATMGDKNVGDRASASSEDLLIQQQQQNVPAFAAASSSVLPLHASPYGMGSTSSPPHVAHSSLVTSPMLPPPSAPALPNPFADTNRVSVAYPTAAAGVITVNNNSKSTKASRSSDTLLTNARASSVFLPLNDEYYYYEDVDLNGTGTSAGPSTNNNYPYNFASTSSLAAVQHNTVPTATTTGGGWKVGQIVSQHGELMPSPTPTNAPKSATADYQGRYQSRHFLPPPTPVIPSAFATAAPPSAYSQPPPPPSAYPYPYPSSSLTSRASSVPPSPSPFDDVVFDLGALPPLATTTTGTTANAASSSGSNGIGRSTSTKTTMGVRKYVQSLGRRERKSSTTSTSTSTNAAAAGGGEASSFPSSVSSRRSLKNVFGFGMRSPPANFPSDAHEEDEDEDGDDFEYDNVNTPRSAAASSMYSIASTSVSMMTPAMAAIPIPPVPPLNLAKLHIPTATASTSTSANVATKHRSAIPSPPPFPDDVDDEDEVETPVTTTADSPTLPMTAQSDGEFVRHMLADVFGPSDDSGHEREQGVVVMEPSLPTPAAPLTPHIIPPSTPTTPALPLPLPSLTEPSSSSSQALQASMTTTMASSAMNTSPSRRPRPNWI